MYLYRRLYIGGEYEHRNVSGELDVVSVDGKLHLDAKQISSINLHIGYWRKANAIHGWFVKHCAEGIDNCQPARVTNEQLIELRELCKKILDMPEGPERQKLIESELPPVDGCFFGSTDIDEGYFQALRHTVEILKDIKFIDAEYEECPYFDGYYYKASW